MTTRTSIPQMEPSFDAAEPRAIADYMANGGWLTEHTKTAEFEESLKDYIGSQHVVILPNGTLSLTVALLALGIGRGDEVIVPDMTMIASANSVLLAGAGCVLADVEPTTLCLDRTACERAITPKTKAIMLVSLNGRSPDMTEWAGFAKRRGLALIEDAAQSLGSRCQGRHLGTFGDVGSFSFSAPKIITTGQGGCLVTDRADLAHRIRLIKDFGRERAGVDKHISLGFNFKFTDLQAVVGLEQMKKLPWRANRKKDIFALYRSLLADLPEVRFLETDLTQTSPWFVDIYVARRDELAAVLRAAGIGSRPVYPPVHTQAPYHSAGRYPISTQASHTGLWLPSGSNLTDDEVSKICRAIRSFYGK